MLPEKFEERMRSLMGDEYELLRSALELPPVKGYRVNSNKISTQDYLEIHEGELESLSYVPTGFIPSSSEGVGKTPEHHSGMIYVQDPGAMATVCALEIPIGGLVLDACAAPGGKASQLAS